jgi:ArsR family transcriptional regulator, arsenate/arsenite/antimonite-responsive transcriptional repressor
MSTQAPQSTAAASPKLDETQAVRALAALAQAQRLRVFRALVTAGEQGLTPSVLAALLEVAPSALSFHLKELAHAGLVSVEPKGRHLVYRAAYLQMSALLAYLMQNCCAADPQSAGCGC